METLVLFIAAVIGGPLVLAAALGYALWSHRKMTQADRLALREAVGEVYAESEEDDGSPIRVNVERRRREANFRPRTFAGSAR